MLRKLTQMIRRPNRRFKEVKAYRTLRYEALETRCLLAIVWANELNANNNFDDHFGANELIARQLVNRAINDWERVILDTSLSLDIFAAPIGGRGVTENITLDTNDRPDSADITLDDNGGGRGWYFDPTPLDDSEFTAIVNSGASGTEPTFHGSFVDVEGGHVDFYRTIVHEIGHALGLGMIPDTPLSITSQFMTHIGADPSPNDLTDHLFTFYRSGSQFGVTATFTTSGGGHLYEGNHPNDLMNPGRIAPIGSPTETTRQLISD